MKIYMMVEPLDFGEKQAEAVEAISEWAAANAPHIHFVCSFEEVDTEGLVALGVETEIKRAKFLNPTLVALNNIAQTYKVDFVVGEISVDGGREDVCYFGYEEGRPDPYAIASYLNLS